ncbi:MAG: 23S rRNA (pseudouridine(1915)-N(3))-methyltransferase RlmH [Christensenellales bacterium]|mgnify:CR=1 FL=1|nr:23S rRNA (pseudouridine(1915)-N(3))-methyltransferase RlmH [Clostridiales bacterium]
MKISLIAVGKLKEDYWKKAIADYEKRLKPFCDFEITEITEGKSLKEEAQNIKKKLKGCVIVFDIHGHMTTSEEFAEIFSLNMNRGVSAFSLVIGGSEGLDEELKKAADYRISFGKVTYPHRLMRVIAVEQIYRAMTIINNLTYHK